MKFCIWKEKGNIIYIQYFLLFKLYPSPFNWIYKLHETSNLHVSTMPHFLSNNVCYSPLNLHQMFLKLGEQTFLSHICQLMFLIAYIICLFKYNIITIKAESYISYLKLELKIKLISFQHGKVSSPTLTCVITILKNRVHNWVGKKSVIVIRHYYCYFVTTTLTFIVSVKTFTINY